MDERSRKYLSELKVGSTPDSSEQEILRYRVLICSILDSVGVPVWIERYFSVLVSGLPGRGSRPEHVTEYKLMARELEDEFNASGYFKEIDQDGLWGSFDLSDHQDLLRLKKIYDDLISIQVING
jgi:hypothetical protein